MSMPLMTAIGGPRAPRAAHPPGMDTQPTTVAASRIHGFLEREPVVWLSTVRPDGGPHLVPIWFWWDGEALLVFSKPGAQKVRNLRAHPSVMLALGDAEDDFDVGLLRGRAELLDQPDQRRPARRPSRQVRRQARRDRRSAPRSTRRPTRRSSGSCPRTSCRGTAGRRHRASASPGPRRPRSTSRAGTASDPMASPSPGGLARSARPIVEPTPTRSSLRDWLGEPLARGLRGLTGGSRVPAPGRRRLTSVRARAATPDRSTTRRRTSPPPPPFAT